MKVLVTGLPRSGTSVTANLLAISTGSTILDDPPSLKRIDFGSATDVQLRSILRGCSDFEIVKAPRLTEALPRLQEIDAELLTVHVVRDPRDVFCSTIEKARLGRKTSMLDNERFGAAAGDELGGVALAAEHYHATQASSVETRPDRNWILCYEHLESDLVGAIRGLCRSLGLEGRLVTEGEVFTQWGPTEAKEIDRVIGPGRWHRELAAADSDRIMEIAGTAHSEAMALCCCAQCVTDQPNDQSG